LAVALLAFVHVTVASAQPELIDRTMAVVGGQVITLSEVRTALVLGLVEGDVASDPIASATDRLIERTLVLREVRRYAPTEPAPEIVDKAVDAARARLPGASLKEQLDAGGLSESWFRAWIRDDLRMANYLAQRFAAGAPDESRRQELITDWISELRRRTPIVELYKRQ
jgi:hypothetical protein